MRLSQYQVSYQNSFRRLKMISIQWHKRDKSILLDSWKGYDPRLLTMVWNCLRIEGYAEGSEKKRWKWLVCLLQSSAIDLQLPQKKSAQQNRHDRKW